MGPINIHFHREIKKKIFFISETAMYPVPCRTEIQSLNTSIQITSSPKPIKACHKSLIDQSEGKLQKHESFISSDIRIKGTL